MRKIFTIICLMMFFNIMAQSHKIDVRVEDHCQNLFTKPIVLDLYKFSGADTTYIASSTVNPATFTGLDENENYMVKIKSDDKSKTDLNLKDIHLLRQHILGTKPGTKATFYSGDISKDSWVSTLDMVLLSRRLIGYPNINLDNWFFMALYLFTEDSGLKYINKVYCYNGVNSATLIAFNKGDISASYFDCTTTCPLDSTIKNTISFPFLDVKKDESIEFEIKFDRNLKNLGYLFSLVYKDLQVESIVTLNGGNHNNISADNTINFINLFFDSAKDLFHGVAKVRVKPFKNGNLASMISLNPNFNAEAIYQTDNCIASNPIFNLINTDLTCPITWPADITVKDCNAVYNTGEPFIVEDCKENTSTSYTDQVFGNPCQKILRQWQILNWLTLDFFSHLQTITINADYNIVCVDAQLSLEEAKTVYAVDFVNVPIQGHEYSFSATSSEPSKLLSYSYPYIEFTRIYDLSSNEFCIAKITKLGCNNVANVNDEVDVKSNGLAFYTVTAEMFNAGNPTTCLFNLTSFQISNTSSSNFTDLMYFPTDEYKGKSIYLKLRYVVEGNFVEHGLVKVNFIDQLIPVLNFNCFDDLVVKNEPIQIDFFSPNFNLIQAIQGGILVKDATITSTKKARLKDVAFNQKSTSLIFVWLEENLKPLTLTSTDTLFSMVILPTKSGKVSDFISLSDSLAPAEAVYIDLTLSKIDLVFNFMQRINSTKDNYDFGKDILLSPNPNSGNLLNINAKNTLISNIKISDLNGRSLFEKELLNSDTQQIQLPNDMPNGLYLVEISSPKGRVIKKLIISI